MRDSAIDILKFIAILLITNSHLDSLYPDQISYAGTGGAIGDALFFFCSGYTLFMKPMGRFDLWYKKRIRRIYPTVLMWVFLSSMFFSSHENVDNNILISGGWFVNCILIYYVVAYLINNFFSKKLKLFFPFIFIITIITYIFIDKPVDYDIYGDTYLKWIFFFMFMLQGAIFGTSRKPAFKFSRCITTCLISICLYYGTLLACELSLMPNYMQLLSILIMLMITYSLYGICSTPVIQKIFLLPKVNFTIMTVGGLCLEIYMVQSRLIPLFTSILFPLNIILVFFSIVLCAYFVRIFSRFFMQTFDKDDYNWRKIFSNV